MPSRAALILLAFAIGVLVPTVAAQAHEDDAPPRLQWDLTLKARTQWALDEAANSAPPYSLFPESKLHAVLALTPILGLGGELKLDQVEDPQSLRFFQDPGFYVDKLYAQADPGRWLIRAGKVTIPFGLAWDEAPGIYGDALAKDIKTDKQLGAHVTVPLASGWHEAHLSAAVFWEDTTFLSDALGDADERNKLSDGGAGNTGGPQNFSVELRGTTNEVGWSAGGRRRAAGQGDPEDEWTAFVGGELSGKAAVAGVELDWRTLGEAAYIANYNGRRPDVWLMTAGGAVDHGPWELSAVYSARRRSIGPMDHMITVSAQWRLLEHVTAELGYAFFRQLGQDTQLLGLSMELKFGGGWGRPPGR